MITTLQCHHISRWPNNVRVSVFMLLLYLSFFMKYKHDCFVWRTAGWRKCIVQCAPKSLMNHCKHDVDALRTIKMLSKTISVQYTMIWKCCIEISRTLALLLQGGMNVMVDIQMGKKCSEWCLTAEFSYYLSIGSECIFRVITLENDKEALNGMVE